MKIMKKYVFQCFGDFLSHSQHRHMNIHISMCSPNGILHLKPIKPMFTCWLLKISQAKVATDLCFHVLLSHDF